MTELIELAAGKLKLASLKLPNPLFDPAKCYWPDTIGLAEKFSPIWAIINNTSTDSVDANIFLGLSYKGKSYYFTFSEEGSQVYPLPKNHEVIIKGTDFTIESLFAKIETFTASTTLQLIFQTGYVSADGTLNLTDTWPVSCYVKVSKVPPKIAGVPTWALAAGGGAVVAVVGIGLVLKKRKK
jgi:hypothetical protein